MIDKTDPTPLNPWQRAALAAYAEGDYADAETMGEVTTIGDTIVEGIMIELSEAEGCTDAHEAKRRMISIMRDITDMADAVQAKILVDTLALPG